MKISGKKSVQRSKSIRKSESSKKAEKVEPLVRRPSSDINVDISSTAKDLDEAKSQIQDLPDIRAEEVERVSMSLHKGTYQVEAKKVAKKIIHESLKESWQSRRKK